MDHRLVVVQWLRGACHVHNLTIDFPGGWNERAHSAAYLLLHGILLQSARI